MSDELATVAQLVAERNRIDDRIAHLIHRPVTVGHLGEWIAAQVFNIALEKSAATAAIDGHFRSGDLAYRTVNIKWYLKREGVLDMTPAEQLDYYLVLTGPASAAASSWDTTRPLVISNVYLFDARTLRDSMMSAGRRVGVASGVHAAEWLDAEIYPNSRNPRVSVSAAQRDQLKLFADM